MTSRQDRPPPDAIWRPIVSAPRDGTRIAVFSHAMGESEAWWSEGTLSWVEALGSGYMAAYQEWTHWKLIDVGNEPKGEDS